MSSKWMDWLKVNEEQLARVDRLVKFAQEVKEAGFTQALLLGMGGSSLCPEVMRMTFGKQNGFPDLQVLDSTDPAQVRAREASIDFAKTLFIVSSKSGSTLEPNIFKEYFYDRCRVKVGADKVGQHFVAITDPGSQMNKVAENDKFRHVFYGLPAIGGRYSALSDFGMVPAAVMGLEVKRFLDTTAQMVHACAASVSVAENPGALLGVIMGVLANAGRNKVTLITSDAIFDLGAWLEQLLAESTGKEGKALIPVDREDLTNQSVYGQDRLFVYLRLDQNGVDAKDSVVDALEKAGQPVVRISLPDVYHLGQEFFRWEIATAVAGAIMQINPFNQPDVEASKIATRELTDAYEKTGSLPAEKPVFEHSGIKLYTDEKNAKELTETVGAQKNLVAYLKAHFNRIKDGDYFAVLGYIEMTAEHEASLQKIRHLVLSKKKVATCLGFWPAILTLHRPGLQGRTEHWCFLANYL